MGLPRLDLPIEMLHWELFLPDRYNVKRFEGDAMPETAAMAPGAAPGAVKSEAQGTLARMRSLRKDQIGGVVVDTTGAVIPGASVMVVQGASYRRTQVTAADGSFLFSSVPSGPVAVTATLPGFKASVTELQESGVAIQVPLEVGAVQESVVRTRNTLDFVQALPASPSQPQAPTQNAPSQNVLNLQQRVSGVLPVRIDVPRNGQSFRFVRALVLDEETTLRFEYKMR